MNMVDDSTFVSFYTATLEWHKDTCTHEEYVFFFPHIEEIESKVVPGKKLVPKRTIATLSNENGDPHILEIWRAEKCETRADKDKFTWNSSNLNSAGSNEIGFDQLTSDAHSPQVRFFLTADLTLSQQLINDSTNDPIKVPTPLFISFYKAVNDGRIMSTPEGQNTAFERSQATDV